MALQALQEWAWEGTNRIRMIMFQWTHIPEVFIYPLLLWDPITNASNQYE